MGQALYRKYRSKSLAEIVGQEHITKALEGSLKSGRISHAYLLTGPRGTGKTSIARILAHEINGLPYTDDSNHLDIIEIDAASNRRIDDIRDLREKVHIAPVSAKYKVYIIDEVHMLTGESFNALLKTLEEPPEHAVFILATTEVHKLPATIISRAQRYSFRAADKTKLVKHLKSVAKKEKIEVDDPALELIAEHGGGSFRDSLGLLDQLANVAGGKISAETVEQTLGLAPLTAVHDLIKLLETKDHKKIAAKLSELEASGTSTTVLTTQLLAALRSHAHDNPKLFLLIDRLLDVPKAHNPQLKLLTTLLDYSLNLSGEAEIKRAAAHSSVKPVLEIKSPARAIAPTNTPLAGGMVQGPPQTRAVSSMIGERTLTGPATIASAIDDISPEQWNQVLEVTRKQNPPLYAVVRMAQPSFDPQTQILTLGFRFALHGKKLEDAKHKTKLAGIISDILGSCPEITISTAGPASDGRSPGVTGPAAPATKNKELDAQTKSVLDILGGGEVIEHAETA